MGACTTADPAPTNEITAETIAKVNAYGTSQGLTLTRTPDDVFYAITLAKPTARAPKTGEYFKLHYVYTNLEGKILDSTAINRNIPYSSLYLASPNSLESYMALFMKEGETGVFVFPTTVTNLKESVVMKATFVSTRNETEQIDEYVKEKFPNLAFKKTASGLQYLITKISASGDTIKNNKTAAIAYTGRFLYQYKSTDTIGFPSYADRFDGGNFSFVVGQTGAAIAGFQEAAKLMKVGDKGVFIFPSSLGYGTGGSGRILGYTPLLFEMEITGVK
jgi:FKBP-type peptidyl-prolyl cis-trans isomerase